MSEGWGDAAESVGEGREGNQEGWDDNKSSEGGKTGEGWGENENEEKESGVEGNEEVDEAVPAADREGGEDTTHGEGAQGNEERWREERSKESNEDPGRMESGKSDGRSKEGEGENAKKGAPPDVNQMHTLKVDNLPFRVEADELREEFQRLVRESGGGGGVWGEEWGREGKEIVVVGWEGGRMREGEFHSLSSEKKSSLEFSTVQIQTLACRLIL